MNNNKNETLGKNITNSFVNITLTHNKKINPLQKLSYYFLILLLIIFIFFFYCYHNFINKKTNPKNVRKNATI